MNDPDLILLADLILYVHAAFIAFVVIGQLLIVIGLMRKWRWVKNFAFRIAHLAAIAFVVAQAWMGAICPLTIWEGNLRRAAGQEFYSGSFIAHYVQQIIYWDLPGWVFTAIYTAFGLIVAATWVWGGPAPRRS